MAKKLVFDRPLSITSNPDSIVTVPDGEVWKATLIHTGVGSELEFSETNFNAEYSNGLRYLILGKGAKIKSRYPTFITGIAFKVVEA